MAKFNPALHPRGPNGRFTRSYAKQMSALDGRKASKTKGGFKAKLFQGAEDARAYLSNLFGTRKSSGEGAASPAPAGSPLADLISSGSFTKANQTLRSGKTGPEADSVKALMKPLPDDLQLFRQIPRDKLGGASGDPTGLKNFKVSDAGFFPTTIAPTQPGPGTVQMKISAPAGTPAAVDPDSGQIVLGDGVEMAVDDVQVQPDGSTSMDLVVLPDGSAPAGRADPGATAPASVEAPDSNRSPAAPDFDQRLADARAGDDALASAPANMLNAESGLTREQFDAVDEYRDIFYTGVNNALRGGPTNDEVQARIDHMDAAMEASRLTSDVVTYRGLMNASIMFGDRLGGDLTGMEWDEQAYSSTSASRDLAEEFATNTHDLSRSVVMRMLVPAGTGGITLSDANNESGYPPESEVLLQRGLRLRVVADNGGTPRQIDVEVVPDGA